MKFANLFCSFCLVFGMVLEVNAQERYAVFFKFKPQTQFSLSKPQDFLTAKALERRTREKISADSLDLPVSEKYIAEVKSKSSDYLYSSKWLNLAVIVATPSQVDAIKALPFVSKVELAARGFLTRPGAKISAESPTNSDRPIHPKWNFREQEIQSNAYDFQNQLIGIDKMHEAGFTGKGVTVAVFDAGFPGMRGATPFAHLFTNNQVIGQLDVVRPWNSDVFVDNQHGTNVTSLIGANEPGKLVSGAYGANFILVITEEVATEYRIEEFNWVRGMEFADSLGVDVVNSSLGYYDFDDPSMDYSITKLDGKTAFITQGANIAGNKGILLVNSVGNYGARGAGSLTAPADAFGILSVGSVTTSSAVSTFSSRGPTGDGRFKPELAAFGQAPVLVRSNGTIGAGQGTSFSAPQIAALAAGLWQARPEWTKDQLILNLLRSATQYQNPDNNLGYGIPNFTTAFLGEILSLEDPENEGWKIYPNPLETDELTILIGGESENANLTVLDVTGKAVLDQKLIPNPTSRLFQVNLSPLRPGLYFIQMQNGNLVKRAKLIKK